MRINTDCLIAVADSQTPNFLRNRNPRASLCPGSGYAMTLANGASGMPGTDRPGHMRQGASVLEIAGYYTKTVFPELERTLGAHGA